MRWLVSELDYRDPDDKLHDIDGGNYLSALQELPQNLRQLLEDSDCHCELRETDGRYRVVKIVKKRDPEFLQSTERHFYLDETGRKVPVSEDELDELLGIQKNKEDLYEQEEIELVGLDSEAVPPMDTWDIVYDATGYLSQIRKSATTLVSAGIPITSETLYDLSLQSPDKGGIYSADWFPYREDKRIRTPRAKHIAHLIQTKDLTRRDLIQLMGKSQDYRKQVLLDTKKKVRQAQTVQKRRVYLKRAHILQKQIKDKPFRDSSVTSSEKRVLWRLWRNEQIRKNGAVSLTSWQYEAMLFRKYQLKVIREEITQKEAQQKIDQLMRKHFPRARRTSNYGRYTHSKTPDWLKTAEQLVREHQEDDYEFVPQDWLEPQVLEEKEG